MNVKLKKYLESDKTQADIIAELEKIIKNSVSLEEIKLLEFSCNEIFSIFPSFSNNNDSVIKEMKDLIRQHLLECLHFQEQHIKQKELITNFKQKRIKQLEKATDIESLSEIKTRFGNDLQFIDSLKQTLLELISSADNKIKTLLNKKKN